MAASRLFFCELWSGVERGQNPLWGGIGTQQDHSEFTDLVLGFFPPKLSSPSSSSVSSTCGLNKSQILLCLANAADANFKSGKSFSFYFQAERAGRRGRKTLEEEWIKNWIARSGFWFCMQVFFSTAFIVCDRDRKILMKRFLCKWCKKTPSGVGLTPTQSDFSWGASVCHPECHGR